MSNLLRPYNYWESNGQYFFDTLSGARYVAYFLDLSSFAENLYTFNFDRIQDGAPNNVDSNVFDTICAILQEFFFNHQNSMLLVCDTTDGREEARMRLFNSWFIRIAPEGLTKIDRSGKAEEYNLFVSLLVWADNPMRDTLVSLLEEYCKAMLQ